MNIRGCALGLAGAIALLFAPVAYTAEKLPKSEFKVTDGYFQAKTYANSKPVHLEGHGHKPPLQLRLGEKFNLWISFESKNSPCTFRDAPKCKMILEFGDAQTKSAWEKTWEQMISFNNSSHMELDVEGWVPKIAAPVDGIIRLRITDDNEKDIFSYEIPVTLTVR